MIGYALKRMWVKDETWAWALPCWETRDVNCPGYRRGRYGQLKQRKKQGRKLLPEPAIDEALLVSAAIESAIRFPEKKTHDNRLPEENASGLLITSHVQADLGLGLLATCFGIFMPSCRNDAPPEWSKWAKIMPITDVQII